MEEYTRCSWVNPKDPYSIQYHDIEWGIPVHSDRKLFEMLISGVLSSRPLLGRVFSTSERHFGVHLMSSILRSSQTIRPAR